MNASLAEAQMYLDANRPQDALRVLARSLATEPDDARALTLLGAAHLANDRSRESAREAFTAASHAIALDNQNAYTWRVLAVTYSRLSDVSHARQAARTAQTLAPHDWTSYTTIAAIDADSKYVTSDTHVAVAEAIRLAPNRPEVYFTAGRVAQVEGNLDQARTYYEQVLGLDPAHASARNNLAVIDLKRGNSGRAAAGLVSLLADNPNSELALRNLRATGFRSLRVIYLLLAVCLIVVNSLATTSVSAGGRRIETVVLAAAATAAVLAYVLWIRSKAGSYFGRFIRSVPATDKVLTAWAIILALCYLVIVAAVFVPLGLATRLYVLTEFVLIAAALTVTVVNLSRRAARS